MVVDDKKEVLSYCPNFHRIVNFEYAKDLWIGSEAIAEISAGQVGYVWINGNSSSKVRQDIKFNRFIKEVKTKLLQFGNNEREITDILVKFLYGIKSNKHKMLLWNCYGDVIYQNLSKHIKPKTKSIQCIDCGEWFNVLISDNRTCRCEDCKREHIQVLRKMQNQRAYEKRKH